MLFPRDPIRAHRLARSLGRLSRETRLALIVHEVRNALMTVGGYLELMEEHSLCERDWGKALSSSRHSLERATELLDNIQVAASADAGLLRVTRSVCKIDRVVESALRSARPQAQRQGIEILRVVAPDLTVHADPSRIEQVLLNLLSNAIRHTNAGGHVSINVSADNGKRRLVSVSDDGRGIPAEVITNLGQLLPPPERTAIQRGPAGFGLGLYVVRSILAAHGSELSVASSLGLGTTMSFTLPAPPR